jgi:hypothetical protein
MAVVSMFSVGVATIATIRAIIAAIIAIISVATVASVAASIATTDSEVLVMENSMRVLNSIDGGNLVGLLLDVCYYGWILNNEWNLLINCVLFDLVDCEFIGVGDFEGHLDLSGVWNLVFNNIWLLDLSCEVNLVVNSEWELLLNMEGFLFVLSDWNLF